MNLCAARRRELSELLRRVERRVDSALTASVPSDEYAQGVEDATDMFRHELAERLGL